MTNRTKGLLPSLFAYLFLFMSLLLVSCADDAPSAATGAEKSATAADSFTPTLPSEISLDDSCCGRVIVSVRNNANGTTGSAIAGVEVRLRRGDTRIATVVTNNEGIATFTGVCNGEFNLQLSKSGYANVSRTGIVLDGPGCDTVRLTLGMTANSTGGGDSCCRGILRVIPRDSATNAIVSGASVRISNANGVSRTGTTTDGGFTFRELCAGTYNVRIAKEGTPAYRVLEYTVTITCNDSIASTRTISRTTTNTGGGDSCCRGIARIVPRDSATGAVISGATVRITPVNSTTSRTGTTTDGGFTFRELCRGTYNVRIAKEGTPGYRVLEFQITVGCNDSQMVSRTMGRTNTTPVDTCCNGVLRIGVRDTATGNSLSGASIRISRNGTSRTLTSGNEPATFRELCAGTYSVRIARDGYRVIEFTVTVTCNGTVTVTRSLQRNSEPPPLRREPERRRNAD